MNNITWVIEGLMVQESRWLQRMGCQLVRDELTNVYRPKWAANLLGRFLPAIAF
jgi:hypothetical protein